MTVNCSVQAGKTIHSPTGANKIQQPQRQTTASPERVHSDRQVAFTVSSLGVPGSGVSNWGTRKAVR